MKPKKTVFAVGAFTAGAFAAYKAARYAESVKKAVSSLPKDFTVTAHTGVNGTKANSFASLAAALSGTADIIETDLNFTENGTPVLSHDKPVGDCVSLFDALSFAAKYPEKRINIDVKSTEHLCLLPKIATDTLTAESIFFTGIESEDVPTVKKDAPAFSYWLNGKPDKGRLKDREYLLSIVNEVKAAGAIGLNIKYTYASKELVRIMHENGLYVSLWTANSTGQMLRSLLTLPDNITTKKPERLRFIIAAFSK